jgi:hypothetical protein
MAFRFKNHIQLRLCQNRKIQCFVSICINDYNMYNQRIYPKIWTRFSVKNQNLGKIHQNSKIQHLSRKIYQMKLYAKLI